MEWRPTPVFLLREFHGQRSLLGYSPWGCKELDTTEQLTHTHTHTHEDLDLNLCLMTLLLQLTILIIVGVTYKVIVSCLLHCISPTPIKIMIPKSLKLLITSIVLKKLMNMKNARVR